MIVFIRNHVFEKKNCIARGVLKNCAWTCSLILCLFRLLAVRDFKKFADSNSTQQNLVMTPCRHQEMFWLSYLYSNTIPRSVVRSFQLYYLPSGNFTKLLKMAQSKLWVFPSNVAMFNSYFMHVYAILTYPEGTLPGTNEDAIYNIKHLTAENHQKLYHGFGQIPS